MNILKQYFAITVLVLVGASSQAESLLESFGNGGNAFTMEFVTIGNPNNLADIRYTDYPSLPSGAGSVAYTYNLSKHEVSRDMINKANTAGGLGITMADMSGYGGNGVNKPAAGVSWYEAATYVNWLNTSTGNTVAYKFDDSGNFQLWSSTDAGYNANNMFRNSLAKYVIASSDEWYKGAYANLDGTWNNYPTGSDSAPTPVAGGTDANTAVYSPYWERADITNAGGLSPYGTMAQGGNVFELTETAYDGSNDTAGEMREVRGGPGAFGSIDLLASRRNGTDPWTETQLGFRVASVPEPSALSLLAVGLGGLAMMRRRRS